MNSLKPIIKWPGGKRRIARKLVELFPLVQLNKYYEPFCGSMSILIEAFNQGNIDPIETDTFMYDKDGYLINLYEQLMKYSEEVIEQLRIMFLEFEYLNSREQREYYYDRQEEHNTEIISDFRRAALMMFLNKTCFNGKAPIISGHIFNGESFTPRIFRVFIRNWHHWFGFNL